MIRQAVCYNRANVKIVGHAAGQSMGYTGPSHHTLEDIALMRALPHARAPTRLIVGGDAVPVIGYMHRGHEKLFEQRDFRQITNLCSRMDWLSGFNNELPLALSVALAACGGDEAQQQMPPAP